MASNNKFLTNSQQLESLAKEKTLSDIDNVLRDGTISVSVSGGGSGVDSVITDVDFGVGSQTNALTIVNNDDAKTGDAVGPNTIGPVIMASKAGLAAPLNISNSTNSLYVNILECAYGNLGINWNQTASQGIATGNGPASFLGGVVPRIVISNDNDEIDVNISEIAGATIATGTGPASASTQRVAIADNSLLYQFMGSTDSFGGDLTTFGSMAFENPSLLSADSAIQLSCADNLDTGNVIVTGLNEAWDVVTETYNLTGQTPVTKSTEFFRINNLQYIGSNTSLEAVYVSPAGAATTLGVPSSQANYLYSMQAGFNNSQLCMGTVPPLADTNLHFIKFQASIVNNADSENPIVVSVKRTNMSLWNQEMTIYVKEDSNTQLNYDLRGYPHTDNSDTNFGHDFRVQGAAWGSGTCFGFASFIVEVINNS